MRFSAILISICVALSALMAIGFAADGLRNNFGTATGAIELMASSLALLWVFIGGSLMRRNRDWIRVFIQSLRGSWQLKFVLFATSLALLEEAITTTLTNLAPFFGSRLGEAYITASSNYLEVVLYNSVIVFVPMFIVWAWLLARADFHPNTVLLLFGLNGVIAEAIYGGATALIGAPFWILVYGLMVYLPAYSLPSDRGANKPCWFHVLAALVLPLLAAALVAVVVLSFAPYLPHFGPDFTK
jgi:hypothetical protein